MEEIQQSVTAIHTDGQTSRQAGIQTDRQRQTTVSTAALSITEKKAMFGRGEFLKRLFCVDFMQIKRKTRGEKEARESMGVGVSMRQPFGNQSSVLEARLRPSGQIQTAPTSAS